MAGELKHPSVGSVLARGEWESGSAHELEGQQVGDMVGADAGNVLTRLPIGTDGEVLRTIDGAPAWGFSPGSITFTWALS